MNPQAAIWLGALCVFCVLVSGAMGRAADSKTEDSKTGEQATPKTAPKAAKVEKRKGVTIHHDIEYAKVGDHSLKLDLYMPTNVKQKPHLVVFFHGGSWRTGSKKTCHNHRSQRQYQVWE